MNDGALKAALEREERAYEDLVRVRASLGSMLAETIRKDRDLSEFVQHMRDLPLLTRNADLRRTELKVELLSRQLKKAEEEQRRATAAAKRAASALEEAKRSYAQAANVERRWALERRRLEELRREEMARLERLRSQEAEQQEGEEGRFSGYSRTAEEFELPLEQERSQEPSGGPQSAAEAGVVEEPRPGGEDPQEPPERPWWRRVFGG
jgi:hypothetical protein